MPPGGHAWRRSHHRSGQHLRQVPERGRRGDREAADARASLGYPLAHRERERGVGAERGERSVFGGS